MNDFKRDMQLMDHQIIEPTSGRPLFERFGGRPTLDRVHKIFYDLIYAHPWMSLYFKNIDQKTIESQQSDFMAHLTGGPRVYCGRMPIDAHRHILVTEELFDVRHELLRQSLVEAGVPAKERDEWLRIDMAFKKVLLKKSHADCSKRYFTDEILDFADPRRKAG